MKKFFFMAMLVLSFCAFHTEEASAKKIGAWEVTKEIDEMDDSVKHFVITDSKSGCMDSYGRTTHPTLAFYKDGNDRPACMIIRLPWLGTQEIKSVEYRLDKEKSKKSSGWLGKETTIILFEPESFARKLYSHEKLVIRITAHDGVTRTVKFDISGAKEALSEFAKVSGWK